MDLICSIEIKKERSSGKEGKKMINKGCLLFCHIQGQLN